MKVTLRKWKLTDAAELATIANDKKLQDNLRDGLPFPYTEKDAADYISACLSADENESFTFAVIADGRVAGSIGVFRQKNIHRLTAELGYYIGKEFRNRGAATEAVKLIADYIFTNTDIIRIFAEPFSHNEASKRVLEKAGFQAEGVMKNNAIKNGKIIDMTLYAKLKAKI